MAEKGAGLDSNSTNRATAVFKKVVDLVHYPGDKRAEEGLTVEYEFWILGCNGSRWGP